MSTNFSKSFKSYKKNRDHPSRILLVEDDDFTRSVNCKLLTDCDYTVDVAINGTDTLLKLTHNDYDLILLDLELPDIDGISLCRQIRVQFCTLPIIFLTTQDEKMRAEAFLAGAQAFLQKPSGIETLIKTIEKYL